MVSWKTLTALVLLAGLSVGVFAGTLLADRPHAEDDTSRVNRAIQSKLDWYVEHYDLDAQQTERVRRELVEYRQALHKQLRELYREHEAAFRALSDQKRDRIATIIEGAPNSGK